MAWTDALPALLDFIDKRRVVRRIAFFFILWVTAYTTQWTLDFASNSTRQGMEVAAIIGAVWAPLAALQAAIFAFYDKGRAN